MRVIFLVICIMIFGCFSATSQEVEGKNMGKLNLSALALKSFNVQYERQVSGRMTVALSYAKIPKSSLAFKSFIENQINDRSVKVSDFKLGTSIFTPEARYYFGKKGAFHGFYLAAYARFGKYKLRGPVEYFNSSNTDQAVFDGTLNTYMGGVMIGSSFQLSRLLYLDWWILGGSFGGAGGNFSANTPLTPSEQSSLKSALDDLNVPFTTVHSEVNSNGAVVSTSGSMVGVRGLGINLGIRF